MQALLWKRAREPFLGTWSLPGGYLEPGETLEQSIRKHLAAKVDVREVAHLEQLETLSDPDRDPGEWQIATAYLGLVPAGVDPELPADTAWHPVSALPELAFDHREITLAGRERLRAKLSYTNIGFALAPAEFTISELRDGCAARPRARCLGDESPARCCYAGGVIEGTGKRRAPRPRRQPSGRVSSASVSRAPRGHRQFAVAAAAFEQVTDCY